MASEKRWGRYGTYFLLGMMIIGFSFPGFLGVDEGQTYVEPRLCQNDASCYLLCDDRPIEVFCSQNLCQKNSCEEFGYYNYNQKPLTFELNIILNGNNSKLVQRSGDLFILFDSKFDRNKVDLHSSGLSLAHVLEKSDIFFENNCLNAKGQKYCDGQMLVNGEESYSYGIYVPKENDSIELKFTD